MSKLLKLSVAVLALIMLAGCTADNNRRFVQPLEKIVSPYDNGTIYKAGFNERPLFEEKRARNVGDGLIMNVAEASPAAKKTTAKDKAANGDSESGSEKPSRKKNTDREENMINIASDALVGTITMTVIEVLENGNLFVAGGKQVIVDEEDKFVRISGVVDPGNITGGNMIQSTSVADVRIQVDDVHVHSDATAIDYSLGQYTFGNFFQSMQH